MKKMLTSKKTLAGVFAFVLLLIGFGGYFGVHQVLAQASEENDGRFETYYEMELIDHTSDEIFTGKRVGQGKEQKGQELDFKLRLMRNFKLEDGTKIDGYDLLLKKEDMVKLNDRDDLCYRTKDAYPYYSKVPNVELASFIGLTADPSKDDYYIGTISVRETRKEVDGKEAHVFILSAPILQFNRNVEKTRVDYEGELREETKAEIVQKVKEANPNLGGLRAIKIDGEDLSIETWNRVHTGLPFLSLKVEDLLLRVKDEGVGKDVEEKEEPEPDAEKEQIAELQKRIDEMTKKMETLQKEMEASQSVSKEQEKTIEALEKEKNDLEKALKEAQEKLEKSTASEKDKADGFNQMKALEEKIKEIEKSLEETTSRLQEKEKADKGKITTSPDQSGGVLPSPNTKTSGSSTGTLLKMGSKAQDSSADKKAINPYGDSSQSVESGTTKEEPSNKDEDIRYPNKLTPKQPDNHSSGDYSETNPQNTNKGVASKPSKARGTVTENVDNANQDFPIHHEDETDDGLSDMYSADARQFITFMTKNGKTFHLIINHDQDSENVMLLTEVSEDDLLNMVETEEKTEEEVPVKVTEEEGEKEAEKEPEREEKKVEKESSGGTYLLIGLVLIAVLGAGYYFKVVKAKEQKELEAFEEEEDSYVGEADEDNAGQEEEEIDSEDLL